MLKFTSGNEQLSSTEFGEGDATILILIYELELEPLVPVVEIYPFY